MKENFQFDILGLSPEEIESFQNVFDQLHQKFQSEFDYDSEFNFRKFGLFSYYKNVNCRYVIDINKQHNSFVTFAQVQYQSGGGRGGSYNHSEYQTWGVGILKKDFGNVLIRPETFIDKLQEFVHPVELDFEEDKAFSKKFYVVTDDKNKTASAMDQKLRNAVLEIEEAEFVIEIKNNILVIGNRKIVNSESAICFAEFLLKLS